MGKIHLLSIVVLTCVLGCASSPVITPIPYKDRMLIAVSDFRNMTGGTEYDSSMEQYTGNLIYELQQTQCFRLMERKRLEALLQEHKLTQAGLIDPARAKQIGKILGIDAVLLGNLASVDVTENKKSIGSIYTIDERIDVLVDAQLVAVETGEILASSKKTTSFVNTYRVAGGMKDGEKADRAALVNRALQDSAKKIARDMAQQVSKMQ